MSPVIQIGIDIDDQMTIECVIKKPPQPLFLVRKYILRTKSRQDP